MSDRIQIFLAHASEDKAEVLKLYDCFKAKGYKPWLDVKDLIPGQNWREEIPKAIRQSDIFIACLSPQSVSKQGYVQREFRLALNEYAEKPPGTIYLIPLKLDDCEIPDLQLAQLGVNLRDVHWLDYWEPDGFEKLVRAIEYQFGTSEPEESEKPASPFPKLGETQRLQETTSPFPKPPTVLPEKRLQVGDHQRLADLKELLELLYEKLGEFERELIVTSSTNAKFELKQRIKREILPNIRRYEREYWELYPREAIVISDEEAETQLAKVEQAVESIERIPPAEYPPELLPLLQDIRAKLEDLDKAASAKLKVALPLIPAITSYELEMDTEGFMYKTWKAIKKLVRR